jgi:hypothetical protein
LYSLANRKSLLSVLLLGQLKWCFVGSGDSISLFDNMELNVTVRGEIWRNSTVGSVSSSSSTDCSLGTNVRDLAFFNIKTLGLSVGLEVDEESKDVLN